MPVPDHSADHLRGSPEEALPPAPRGDHPARTNFRRIVPVNAAGTMVVASVTAGLLAPQLPPAWLGLWWLAHVLPSLYLFGRWLTRTRPRASHDQRRVRFFDTLSAAFAGAVWGSGALFLPLLEPPQQVLLITVTAGMIAGSAATLAVLLRAAVLFILLAAIPYIAFLLARGTANSLGLAAMAVTFVAVMLIISRIVNSVIGRNKQLYRENAELYRRISAAREDLLDIAESTEAFTFCDAAGKLQFWNRRFPGLLGLAEEAMQAGMPLAGLLEQAGLPPGLLARQTADGETMQRPVLELPNGKWVRARLRRTPRGDCVLILVDITEQQQLFSAVSQARDEALRASQAKSTFLANMSHELRTPLNAIIGFSDIMQQKMFGPVSPKYDEYLRDIHGSGRHLLGIIEDILDLARIEANQIVLNETAVNIQAEMTVCIRLAGQQFDRSTASFVTSLPADLPALLADARLLRQILLNLIGNALKFSPPGAPIEIGAGCNGSDEIELWVRDHGIGISPADQSRIFEPFEQADGQLSRKFGGLGLGLSLVRAFMQAHQGRIHVDSMPGQGSRITAVFPASRTRPDPLPA